MQRSRRCHLKGENKMTGSLQVKRNKYVIVLCYKGEDGKQKQKWISTGLSIEGSNKRKAQKMLNETLAKFQYIEFVDAEKSSFAEFLLDWLELHKTKVQTSTYNGYHHMVHKYIYPYFKSKSIKLENLKPMDIERYYAYIMKSTTLSTNTIIKHHQVIHKCLDYALKNNYIPNNPCDKVDKPQQTFTEYSFLEKEDIDKLIECVKGHKIEIPIYFAIYYGLRRSEILGLTWDCVDLKNDTIKIRQKVIRTFDDNGKLTVEVSKELKTKASYREFPLIPQLKERLLKHQSDIESRRTFLGSEYTTEYLNYICVNEFGNLLNPDYLSASYRKIVRKYDLPQSSFHSLRHSCGSLLLSMGFDIKQIQAYLGHSSFQTTLKIYTHAAKNSKEIITNQLANAISI